MAQKGKAHVEIATADGTLYVIPITPEIVRVIFVKGIGVEAAQNLLEAKGRYSLQMGGKGIQIAY